MTDQGASIGEAGLFDRGDEYAQILNQGLKLTGESRDFYLRGRLDLLLAMVPPPFSPTEILDFGCGTGETTVALARAYPKARVTGVDTAEGAIEFARRTHAELRVSFVAELDRIAEDRFDLCYVNGVFHHVPPTERPRALAWIHSRMRANGRLALFENNPWNPGTRLVMRRISFDRDAQTLSPPQTRLMLEAAGFRVETPTVHIFFFPAGLRAFRRFEPLLRRVPLGGQYLVLGRRE